MNILYLVHDVNDAAVARRVDLLAQAGHAVRIAGFRRRDHVPATVAGAPVVDLGRTADGKLAQRAGQVVRHLLMPGQLRALGADADVIVARQLELLVLAAAIVRPGQRLVYELLDIHRLLLGDGRPARGVQWAEARALRQVDLTIVSSPHFAQDYLNDRRGFHGPTLLVENKVPAFEGLPAPPAAPRAGPPWTIGWFGMLRCRRSADLLTRLAAESQGRVEVVIAGRLSDKEFGADFAGRLSAQPGIRYLGPYTPGDLPRLYGDVHFTWGIDYFEEGLNSSWLLPNRLYEGLAYGAVPIALHGLATARWLEAHGVGMLIDDPARDLGPLLATLDSSGYDALHAAAAAVPRTDVLMTATEARAIAAAITGVAA